ncbi:nucleoside-binding protein [Bacillus sp. OV322]|uniref:BMP family ABC transporter substrate-binding protein n=1 Tax=Bacillus sp. OV322 TaxID=1882764 RepID=UPI0008EA3659|nr:BMP family ABC transporter substrate-binding protein [Bacillus sp. OV322]SFB97502.1 nucleoside-binding protein [Bacillus sp. OV322]
MLKKIGICMLFALLLSGCDKTESSGHLKKAALLVPNTINDQVWGTKGYKGLLAIQSRFGGNIFYKEKMNSKFIVEQAVKDLQGKGVNLIIGHGSEYAEYFNEISDKYPDIRFVSFNGNATKPNTTSLNFKAKAMGFFGGMVAAEMSQTKQIGVLAAYDWQPEVKGFIEGAGFQDQQVKVDVEYVNGWDDEEKALQLLNKMISNGDDIFYPAGDGFNVPVIERLKEKQLYAIGYVSDQSNLGSTTILTSTIQNVDDLYVRAAEKFDKNELKSGNLFFDIQDGVIIMGQYSPLVKKSFQAEMKKYFQLYKETGKLPDELKEG